MKRIVAISALVGTLAGCGPSSYGWDPVLNCTKRDLKNGLCIEATYSCALDSHVVAYYATGPRCFLRRVQ